MSTKDEPDTTILVELPEGVKLVDGELMWKGALVANQPQVHEVSLCVLYAGDWRLWIEAYSTWSVSSSYEDAETLHIQSTTESAQVVLGSDYRITQPPEGFDGSATSSESVFVPPALSMKRHWTDSTALPISSVKEPAAIARLVFLRVAQSPCLVYHSAQSDEQRVR